MINKIAKKLVDNHLTIATAESCTGGLLSSALTDISGSSKFVYLNLVTYSNEAKMNMLHVKKETLEKYGAVSEQTAFEMAAGLYNLTGADICVSTTGIAGPTGGTAEKPVGLMYSTIYIGINQTHKTAKILVTPELPRIELKREFVRRVLLNLYETIECF